MSGVCRKKLLSGFNIVTLMIGCSQRRYLKLFDNPYLLILPLLFYLLWYQIYQKLKENKENILPNTAQEAAILLANMALNT